MLDREQKIVLKIVQMPVKPPEVEGLEAQPGRIF